MEPKYLTHIWAKSPSALEGLYQKVVFVTGSMYQPHAQYHDGKNHVYAFMATATEINMIKQIMLKQKRGK